MKTLYLDCSMGASGDMLTAALLSLLPDRAAALAELNALGIPGVALSLEPREKCGVTGSHYRVSVHGEEERPDEPHRLGAYPKGMSKYWLLLRIPAPRERILGLSAKETAWLVQELTHLPQRLFAGTKEMRALFKRLFMLYDNLPRRSAERVVRIRAAVTELLLALVEAAHTTKALRSADRIAEAIEAVKANLTHDWTLEELATRVGCSASKLLSAFKQQTGAPPHAFLISCRIARAKEMLAAGPQTVASVASDLGFATPQHFAAQFKLATGLTPREWRRMCVKSQT